MSSTARQLSSSADSRLDIRFQSGSHVYVQVFETTAVGYRVELLRPQVFGGIPIGEGATELLARRDAVNNLYAIAAAVGKEWSMPLGLSDAHQQLQAGPTILEQLQAETKRKTAAIPAGKNHATVVAVDWVGGYVPYRLRWGTAHRIGDHFELGADASTKFSKATTEASVHVAWTW